MSLPAIFQQSTRSNLQRDKYSGKPSAKDVKPALLAGAFGGSSGGKARRETMTMAQYAPLSVLFLLVHCSRFATLTAHLLLLLHRLQSLRRPA
jgi:hypothetical protein